MSTKHDACANLSAALRVMAAEVRIIEAKQRILSVMCTSPKCTLFDLAMAGEVLGMKIDFRLQKRRTDR